MESWYSMATNNPVEVDPSQVHSIEVDPSQVQAADSKGWLAQTGDSILHLASGLNPVKMVTGARDLVNSALTSSPAETAKNLGLDSSAAQQKIIDSVKAGDYLTAARHLVGLIPLVGPQLDAIGDNATQPGQLGAALGDAAAFGLTQAVPMSPYLPKALAKVKSVRIAPKITNPNPTEAAAMEYMQGEGVPVSAAAQTGNPYVRNIQKAVDSTPLGAVVAQGAQKATTEGLQDLAGRLADRSNPTPVVPEQAGQAIQSALSGKAAQHAANAETSYNTFRSIEEQPGSMRTVQTGTKQVIDPATKQVTNVPVMEDVPMPVDIKPIKTALKPIYDDMLKWMEPAKRNASAGFTAIKSIIEGPDVIPASQAEAGLGGLKQLAREGAGRNGGLAKFVTPKLQEAIDNAVTAIDPQALRELQAGRAETAAQYGTKAVLDQLRTEPVQTFGQMTYAKDAGIDLLRQVQREAPGELPKVGRAWLEDVLHGPRGAIAEGGFNRADGLWQQWRNLGPETKRLIFQNPLLIADLDKFFLAAKKMAENPNPSGTAILGMSAGSGALIFTHPATGIPMAIGAGALSKMLHSPAGVRALTEGLTVPVGKGAAASIAAARILKLAGQDAQPAQLPAAAQSTDPSQQTGPFATVLPPQ